MLKFGQILTFSNFLHDSVHESRIMFSSQDQSHQNNAVETKPSSFMFSSKLDCDDQQQNNKSNNDNNDKVVISFMCSECSSHFEKESQQLLLKSGHHNLPAWLQPHGTHHHQIMVLHIYIHIYYK